jgi:hypothetical protein
MAPFITQAHKRAASPEHARADAANITGGGPWRSGPDDFSKPIGNVVLPTCSAIYFSAEERQFA